jgi:ArsR family transcriptional regulator
MDASIQDLERIFQALSDGTRIRIIGVLLAGEVCVCDIYAALKIPQSKASRHLAYLRRTGIVETRKEGLWVHYRLATPTAPVIAAVLQVVEHALGHVPDVRTDNQRLKELTGCCATYSKADSALPCCSGKYPAGKPTHV